ncbi:hypothetical protein IAQ61_002470 [Plenodomus lingam]|uniref:uncharacterized protein n=1 Tax=Leptosphaeria maculans TaxID=5022 RepID=UPI003323F4D9|nr:hypothetical protein IAQ61_002470 [Plenodomus lingam]
MQIATIRARKKNAVSDESLKVQHTKCLEVNTDQKVSPRMWITHNVQEHAINQRSVYAISKAQKADDEARHI